MLKCVSSILLELVTLCLNSLRKKNCPRLTGRLRCSSASSKKVTLLKVSIYLVLMNDDVWIDIGFPRLVTYKESDESAEFMINVSKVKLPLS